MINALDYYKKRVKEITKDGGYISKATVELDGHTFSIGWLWEDYTPEEFRLLTADEDVYVMPDGTLLYTITLLMREVI